ncbi:unc-112-related protein isoform X1 [Tribolium castaneum]|uniref:Unc-112-related protein-like Protein n=1 Tax=Tribolium castaneum TaxID=7070 RepID=D6WSN4_TRICA|nr:PREDICTED: unc-112-related protein isoform X1 [Tribolium castaneum]EFA07132.1 Unc-112-related protein-like Protein [Tribolium castaneum]|eukprot:XP_008196309.1 PREDICTED: unc-112-related protein isoform X1 [Tribolium castaneum]
MIANGQIVGDGSWNLRVLVTDLQAERQLRVKSDLHIGGVMLRLVEDLEISMDWSDHALWWPSKNIWLTRTRSTLDQYGVQADALLHFTPMHKNLRVQLPDLRYLDMKVDFSVKTFSAVIHLCKDLGIRHPEELSLCKPLEPCHLKYNYNSMPKKKVENGVAKNGHPNLPPDTNTFIANSSPDGSTGSLDKSGFMCAPVTPSRPPPSSTPVSSPVGNTGSWGRQVYNSETNGYSPNLTTSISSEQLNGSYDSFLAQTPPPPSPEARKHMIRPKSLVEKARMNVAWLDSSLSIMEQGVREYDTLCLRFKFYVFYDLNPKYDAIRINQIYEQARWQLLNEEIDCTEEEMLMFAALQLQVNLQAKQPQPHLDNGNVSSPVEDDIDAALTDLQTTLEGSTINSYANDITQVPELCDELRFLKPKRFTLKAYKRYWFTCRDLHLYLYKSKEEMIHRQNSIYDINLRGCEVTPDVNISQNKYVIKLEVPSAEGMSEMYIRCDEESQYAKWMACCRLASKGRSLADSSYETEKQTILEFLQMQRPADEPAINPSSLDLQAEDYIAPRFLKKFRGKNQRILEAHANVKDLPLIEAKMNYIKAWQSLPDYGLTLFVIKFMGSKKEELLGVAPTRIMKMDITTGDHLKTWRYNTMIAWNVNWEVKHMMIQFEDCNIMFSCSSADCKVVHEFIGGYIFLSTRSKDASQTLNEELFHKLTGGWS